MSIVTEILKLVFIPVIEKPTKEYRLFHEKQIKTLRNRHKTEYKHEDKKELVDL